MKSHAHRTRLLYDDLDSPVREDEILDKPRIILEKIQVDELGTNFDERIVTVY